jgi:superfamily II DNA/RNA helicase
MKGIAITLATREDAEAVAAIEKLTGTKIARVGKSDETPKPAEPKAREERKPAEPKVREERKPAAKAKPRSEKRDEPRPERSPVVEDISGEWNGPLPSFLSHSAG